MIIPLAMESLAIYLTYHHGKRLSADLGKKYLTIPMTISIVLFVILIFELAGPMVNVLKFQSNGVIPMLFKMLFVKKFSIAAGANLIMGLYLMYKNNAF
ncbi:hypothetical protein [Aliikangiella coralliicola]|uniref:Uncharacterized protein n=1 Tax=Aliikangiella coralliicola TaxID=2592383 RepID=A0A545UFZ4_9GAMM|nr:hypothetical protein [Aliikangiella coralliicola]TQV88388.1 hypothetical protein FLL46_07650 [Aliikangiella coralliicola]